MFSLQRLVKFGYVLVLAAAVFVLSRPAPVQAQRTIAYAFLPGEMSGVLSRGILSGFGAPLSSYMNAQTMLMQAGIPAGMSVGGGQGMSGGMMGVGGMGGMGGGMMGMSGGMMGMGGGMRGGMGGMMGMGGGMGMGGMGMGGMGMGGMMGMGGGMGGFAGKGFGGFNGKNAL
ncbi:MAG TPA: hypothetical protein VMF69_05645 [Gemmataceae bacterium]|nr:hypothetical protein [Gemmataceae bacterium]